MIENLKKQIIDRFHFQQADENTIVIGVPFYRADGDGYTLTLEKINDKWILSDDGFTLENETFLYASDETASKQLADIKKRLDLFKVDLDGITIKTEIDINNFADELFSFCETCCLLSTELV